MNRHQKKHPISNSVIIKNIFFWICIFLYFMFSVNINNYGAGHIQLFHSTLKIVSIQIITTYVCIYVLIPKFLNTKKTFLFIFWLAVLLFSMFALYSAINIYLFEPKYIEYYTEIAKFYAQKTFSERIIVFSVLLSKSIKFLTPAALLLMARFYKNQQKLLKQNEQKKTAELSALKHQLNPHFLFNTLNNLYTLAIEKSDTTPEVIERLSHILDYMLYRCDENFVSLKKEIELIDSYLALEKIRYGKRVVVTFEKDIKKDVKIAPLLLLTFIENAFKHGVSQELKQAKININIGLLDQDIIFSLSNTKPKNAVANKLDKTSKPLGLQNIKKQLELLYQNNHILETEENENNFSLSLTLKQH